MNEISNLMLKYWWVAPVVSVFAIAQKRWKIALLLVLTAVVCFAILLSWLDMGMRLSGW
jgi:hypothetical protein